VDSLVKKKTLGLISATVLAGLGAAVWYLHARNFAVLNPAGMIAAKERNLMIITVLLGVTIGLPVYVMLFGIAWRYREANTKATYSPELSGNAVAETIWWGVPTIIILILSVITWQTSHSLDPHRAISSSTKPLVIQAIALDWKWLFIYPEQNIASINYVELPVKTPVEFQVTADAPMNSLWIPQLGGQIYAMPGMATQLHLIADRAGDYRGSSANISGAGFSGMHFIAHADSEQVFRHWVNNAKQAPQALTAGAYTHLVVPSQNLPPEQYSPVQPNLFASVVLKYMGPRG